MAVRSLWIALLLAGCLTGSGPAYDAIEDQVVRDALPRLAPDHDHADASLHNGSWNIERVAYHNGVDDSATPDAIPATGYYTELAVTTNYVYLARASTDGAFGGFSILDIRMPSPVLVGTYDALSGGDIEVNDDETLAFFATQRNLPADMAGGLQATQDPTAVLPRGIHVVDIRDKSAPQIAFFQPLPVNGPHTITYHKHANDDDLLIVCTYDLVSDPVTGSLLGTVPATQRVLVYRIQSDGVLAPLSQWQRTDVAPAGKMYFPHDAIAQQHPDGRTYLYVAYWDRGAQIVDITDPSQPRPVSEYRDFSPSSQTAIHQVRPFDDLLGGRHVTVTEPEIISADETGYIFILDTTDASRPQRLGYWTLPGHLTVNNLDFSPHNFDTWDGKVALAHNHAGVWVLEVEDDPGTPRAVAYYMPAIERDGGPRSQPYVWGVVASGGLLYVSDEATGLHVLRYTGP